MIKGLEHIWCKCFGKTDDEVMEEIATDNDILDDALSDIDVEDYGWIYCLSCDVYLETDFVDGMYNQIFDKEGNERPN